MAKAQVETINITALARMFHKTTGDAEKHLRRAGVDPLAEVVMPSGRRFMTFSKAAAVAALQKHKDMTSPPVSKSGKVLVQAAGLEEEVKELRALVAQLLEAVTKPTNH